MKKIKVYCPFCESEAIYKYGKTRAGKQRFICLLCGRQFTSGANRKEVKNRPVCPDCGSPMHLYKKELHAIRFRCSDYPKCKKYFKIAEK